MRLAAVLRVNNQLLTLMSRLHRAAESQEPESFENEARKLASAFRSDTSGGTRILRTVTPATGREKLVVDSLDEIIQELPERIRELIELARSGDWIALHGRLADQVDHTDDVAEALMREADADLSQEQKLLFEDIDHAERQAAWALAWTGILSLLAATLLGFVVTRSITDPLTVLHAGTRALARGEFDHRIAVTGGNELASLAAIFNGTAGRLADLYGQLRRSEGRFRSLIENASDLIFIASASGELLYASPSSERILGRSPGLLLGKSLRELIDPADFAASERIFSAGNLASCSTQHFEARFQHCDGSPRLLEGVVTNLLDDPAVRGLLINARDISERRKAEEALKRSEERLQELLARETDARHTAELLNQIGRVLSAELDEGRLAQSLIDLTTQLVRAQVGALLYNTDRPEEPSVAFCGGTRGTAERLQSFRRTTLWPGSGEVIRSSDIGAHEGCGATASAADDEGELRIRSYLAAPLISRSRRVFGVLLYGHSDAGTFLERDEVVVKGICAQASIALENARLFEQVNVANRALENSNEALRRANDDLSVFAYSASHDLQEPLRNLSLYSQMLQRSYQGRLDPQADEFIGYVVGGAARMSELVKDLLSYLKISGGHTDSVRPEPVKAAIDKALSNLQGVLTSNRAIVIYDELPYVAVNAVHLQQLFQNLISNAVKYRSTEDPQIQISAMESNGYWCFSVKDNGIGISPQYTSTVFRLFKRLHGHGEYPGTGVGLAICQKIVERHGGRIWVESQPGKGSDFKFTLPQRNE
ncbi:MAG TPA: ATP-binding protein [Bryobacteraceae bacterium]|jgi:PAS domain S-box-containing protein